MDATMTSSRSYLIRAIHEWISDNALTPYILVNAELPESVLPQQFVDKGKIVLNIGAQAADGLHIDADWLLFSARFDGKAMDVTIPIMAVLAIYAKENGQGMVLDHENGDNISPPPSRKKQAKKSHLQLVK